MSIHLVSVAEGGEFRVSSVLNKNSKEYGKQFLTDGSDETCWSSDQGCPQWVAVKWESPIKICKLQVKFQGGFCGSRDTLIEGWTEDGKSWEVLEPWPLEDVGHEQTLTLKESKLLTRLRILFPTSTDFFGRVILYRLDIWGEKN